MMETSNPISSPKEKKRKFMADLTVKYMSLPPCFCHFLKGDKYFASLGNVIFQKGSALTRMDVV